MQRLKRVKIVLTREKNFFIIYYDRKKWLILEKNISIDATIDNHLALNFFTNIISKTNQNTWSIQNTKLIDYNVNKIIETQISSTTRDEHWLVIFIKNDNISRTRSNFELTYNVRIDETRYDIIYKNIYLLQKFEKRNKTFLSIDKYKAIKMFKENNQSIMFSRILFVYQTIDLSNAK